MYTTNSSKQYLNIYFIQQRKHITSPLDNSQCYLEK